MKVSPKARWLSCCAVLLWALAGQGVASADPVEAFTLETGTRVLVREEAGSSSVAICVFLRSRVGDDGRMPGVREVMARSLFGSSAYLPLESVQREIDMVGGSLQVRCEPDYIVITCMTTRDAFDDAFYVISQALKNARMDDETLRRAVGEAEAGIRAVETNPYQSAYAVARETLYRESPYRLPFVAAASAPLRVTRDGVLDFYRRFVTPARTVVAVAGGIDAGTVKRILGVQLRSYDRRSAEGTGLLPAASPEPLEQPLEARRPRPVSTSLVLCAYPGPGLEHRDFAAFSVLGAILGGGKGSRLFRRVRDTGAVGYDVGAETPPLALESHLLAHVEFDPLRAGPAGKPVAPADVERMVRDVVHSALTEPPAESELQRARRYLVGQDLVAHQRLRDRAFYLGWYETVGLGYEFDEEWPRAINAVTAEDVQRVTRTYLTNGVTMTIRPDR